MSIKLMGIIFKADIAFFSISECIDEKRMRRHFVDYFLDTFSKVTLQNHYMIVGHFL